MNMKIKKTNNAEMWSHKNDFPIDEVWNTDNTLAQLIAPRLLAFKALDKHGYPPSLKGMHEWNNVIQKMVDAFEIMKYVRVVSDEEKVIVREGLDLFCKYYLCLWD